MTTPSLSLQKLNEDFYLAFVAPIEAEGFKLLHYDITQNSDTYICNTLVFENPNHYTNSESSDRLHILMTSIWDDDNAKPCFTIDKLLNITFVLIPAIS